jgi:hypothetical protein
MERSGVIGTAAVAGATLLGVIGFAVVNNESNMTATLDTNTTSTSRALTLPDKPGSFQANSPYQVDIQWNTVPNADGYKIFRRPHGVGASYKLIMVLRASELTPTDPMKFSDFPPEVITYDYIVKAFNQFGDSSSIGTTIVVTPQ